MQVSDISRMIKAYICSERRAPGERYWPLVKCVTIKVPNSQDILEHVVLVDVPGTGDFNPARDKMWETVTAEMNSFSFFIVMYKKVIL